MYHGVNSVFRAASIGASGLKASRGWMNIISNNIANVHSVESGRIAEDGNSVPYYRQVPVFEKVLSEKFRRNKVNGDVLNGVAVKETATLQGDVKKVYDPSHPAARKPGTPDAGYVYYPNISVGQEMADLRMASAMYEANMTIVAVSGQMNEQALTLGRGA